MEQLGVFLWNFGTWSWSLEKNILLAAMSLSNRMEHTNTFHQMRNIFEQLLVSAPITRSLELTVTRSPTIFTANVPLFSFAAASVDWITHRRGFRDQSFVPISRQLKMPLDKVDEMGDLMRFPLGRCESISIVWHWWNRIVTSIISSFRSENVQQFPQVSS